jgi:hypothetical protein
VVLTGKEDSSPPPSVHAVYITVDVHVKDTTNVEGHTLDISVIDQFSAAFVRLRTKRQEFF